MPDQESVAADELVNFREESHISTIEKEDEDEIQFLEIRNKHSEPLTSIDLTTLSDEEPVYLKKQPTSRKSNAKRAEPDDPRTPSPPRKYFLRGPPEESSQYSNDKSYDEDYEDLISKISLYKVQSRLYWCNLCNYNTAEMAYIIRHLLRAHGHDRGYECSHCEKTFTDESRLKNHVEKGHPDVENIKMVKCKRCEYESKDKELLNLHILRKHAYRYVCSCCAKCFKTWTAKYLHEKETGKKKQTYLKYVCDKCKVVSATKKKLINHLEKAHCITDAVNVCHPCQHCNLIFLSDKSLRCHLPQHEYDGSGYACAVCAKRLSSREHLKKHERVHTGERPYSCPECGRAFALQNTMRIHQLSHKGIKPYRCEICKLGYSQRSALMIHWKSKHAQLPPPPPIEIRQFFDRDGHVMDT